MCEVGYVLNDFIFQELIKEWVEGLFNLLSFVVFGDVGLMKFLEVVFQKVVVDVRREVEDNRYMIIDLYGLIKGEVWVVVLVVF